MYYDTNHILDPNLRKSKFILPFQKWWHLNFILLHNMFVLLFFYVPNMMGLFYFILMQNQRFHYCTEANILQGHKKVVYDM